MVLKHQMVTFYIHIKILIKIERYGDGEKKNYNGDLKMDSLNGKKIKIMCGNYILSNIIIVIKMEI